MGQSFIRVFRTFFDATTIVQFLIGSLLLSVVGNALSDVIKEVWSSLQILVTFPLLLMLIVFLVSSRLSRLSQDEPDFVSGNRPSTRRGLILLVSQEDVCWSAIEFHRQTLERVWLVASGGAKGTEKLATALRERVHAELPGIVVDTPWIVERVDNPRETYAAVRDIYRNNLPEGWSPSDVICDCTGMLKPATIGMILACIGGDRPVQYTPTNYIDGKPAGPLPPFELEFNWLNITRNPRTSKS